MTTPPPTADVTALARRYRLEVNTSTTATPNWELFPAITEFNWTAEPNVEDSSTYDDEGWAGNEKTGQAWEVTCTFNRRKDKDSTVFHPVHEFVRAAFFGWGATNKVHIRWMDRDGAPEAYEGKAIPNWAPQGGERTALDQVEVTFTGDGPLDQIDNPLTETP